jgi:hypothetical protein
MADIIAERKMIQQEETKPQAAVTESVMSRVGGGINFINTRHYYVKEYCLNGKYNLFLPNYSVDGFFTYPWNFELTDIIVKLGDATGSSGLSELDIKWKPETSGTWQSIFSTTPKWTSAAPVDSSVRIGVTRTGWTAPVLSKTQFDAYDLLRLDVLQGLVGNVNSVFLNIFSRPI